MKHRYIFLIKGMEDIDDEERRVRESHGKDINSMLKNNIIRDYLKMVLPGKPLLLRTY